MIGLSSTKEIFEFVVHENVASKHFIKVVNIYFIDVKAILEQHLTYCLANLGLHCHSPSGTHVTSYIQSYKKLKNKPTLLSGCGTVGRAVASDTREPRFESGHHQFL